MSKCARKFERDVLRHLPLLKERARQFTAGMTRCGYDGQTRRASNAEADDLVQETLLRAWKAWGDEPVESPWAWLFIILRNTYFDRYRDRKKRRLLTEQHRNDVESLTHSKPPPRPDAGVTSGPDDAFLRAIEQITPTQRTVIELQMAGVENAEIARRLRIGLNTVSVTSSKGRARIRDLL